jgi:surface polysaccharide O-acyltransferase-like enzyme
MRYRFCTPAFTVISGVLYTNHVFSAKSADFAYVYVTELDCPVPFIGTGILVKYETGLISLEWSVVTWGPS